MYKDTKTVILSPSANKAILEFNTYNMLKNNGFDCQFIVSDLCGKSFYQTQNSNENPNFIFIKENLNAKNINLSNKVDIIIDLKGAIWYSLNAKPKVTRCKQFLEILEVYAKNMKNDNSLLIVDAYEINNKTYMFKNFLKYRLGIQEKKSLKVQHEEKSTFYYINNFLNKKKITNLFIENKKDINSTIHIAYIQKDNLLKIIEKIKNNA